MGRTRPKKLTSKASIPIVREHEIDIVDDEDQSVLQQIETGVEKAEESEIHLQAAINAAARGKVNEAHIPTPETILSNLRYDELYPPIFSQPATYIRFSSTVEDCSGSQYNMIEEDDAFLKIMNQKRDGSSQCTEDEFEEVISFFEETAQLKQPYAAVDNPPVLAYSEMEECMDNDAVEDSVKRFAKDIYVHWKSKRIRTANRPLLPNLKFETGQDTDDSDPYVCFRRREVRQIRKTRGRDAQSADKLRRLRKELEDARQLVALVRQREVARKEMLAVERQIFVQRSEVKEMKRKLGIKDDDEDLINQKPKKKVVEVPAAQHLASPQLRTARSGAQAAEDLQLLDDVQAEKENEIVREIKQNIAKHVKWNEGYVDLTRRPLSPPPESTFQVAFRPAITTQLPTPPSSNASEEMETALDTQSPHHRDQLIPQAMDIDAGAKRIPSFRRRIGRGGRLMIDRRNLAARYKADMDPLTIDRFKFDREDSDEESTYERDKYDIQVMQHRAIMAAKARDQAVAAAQAHAQAQAQAHSAQVQAQAQAERRLQADRAAANTPNMGHTMGSNPGPGAVAPASQT
ncbi:Enhancer of polycomb-like protein 1 [Monascus purpureus]|uniref:Enhancer of polycomb-like protein n=1 Tax=Monascus purpureus TaxID=5098 RepID=A0A507QP81_MONPU|nr:Enhancer of polycomb-like protein 1 [Monascus purpureus]